MKVENMFMGLNSVTSLKIVSTSFYEQHDPFIHYNNKIVKLFLNGNPIDLVFFYNKFCAMLQFRFNTKLRLPRTGP